MEAAGRPDEKRQKQAGRAGSDPGHVKDSTQNPDSEQLTGRKSLEEADFSLPPGPEQRLLSLLLLVLLFSRSFLAVKSSADSPATRRGFKVKPADLRGPESVCASCPAPLETPDCLLGAAAFTDCGICGDSVVACVFERAWAEWKKWHFYRRRAGLTVRLSVKNIRLRSGTHTSSAQMSSLKFRFFFIS